VSLPRVFVDYSWYGRSTRVTAELFREEMEVFRVGDKVVVEGDSVPDRIATIESIDPATRSARLRIDDDAKDRNMKNDQHRWMVRFGFTTVASSAVVAVLVAVYLTSTFTGGWLDDHSDLTTTLGRIFDVAAVCQLVGIIGLVSVMLRGLYEDKRR
jgi:hypothetical protein